MAQDSDGFIDVASTRNGRRRRGPSRAMRAKGATVLLRDEGEARQAEYRPEDVDRLLAAVAVLRLVGGVRDRCKDHEG